MSSKNGRDESQNFEARLYAIQYVVFAVFAVLAIRFWVLQIAHHETYIQQAENNRTREIPIAAPRGAILDRNGHLLVDNTPAYNVLVAPDLVTSREETIKVLSDNLGVDRNQVTSDLNDPRRPKSQPIVVKQNASDADRAWVAGHQYEHPEISLERQPQRLYPNGKLACHVLGYIGEIGAKQLEDPAYVSAGYRSGDIIGQDGIEKVYDRILRGKDGKRIVVVDSRGRLITELESVEPIKGQDIVTTLDSDVQRVAEEQFDATGDTGAAIVMDTRTGDILALVSRPAFDPNVFARNVISSGNRAELRAIMNDPTTPLFDKAIRGTYPTGSTWKLMIAAAALEEGIITPESSRLVCGGGLQLGNRLVHCMGSHGSPDINAAIVHSCDGYFYRLGLKMGVDKIHDWVVRFGMGQRTGIDLPHEERGIIPDREWKKRNVRDPIWRDFDTVMASVGQGSVNVTPLQLLRAEAGIMMGGRFCTPHVFKEAKATNLAPLKSYEGKTETMRLSASTVDLVSYGAWGVVNAGGTGTAAALPDMDIGGKTGTAQVIAKEKASGGRKHQDHAWFISFAPLHTEQQPELAVVVLTEHGGQGGRASAPKSKMINAAYFSKKLGRSLLPQLVARNKPQ